MSEKRTAKRRSGRATSRQDKDEDVQHILNALANHHPHMMIHVHLETGTSLVNKEVKATSTAYTEKQII